MSWKKKDKQRGGGGGGVMEEGNISSSQSPFGGEGLEVARDRDRVRECESARVLFNGITRK